MLVYFQSVCRKGGQKQAELINKTIFKSLIRLIMCNKLTKWIFFFLNFFLGGGGVKVVIITKKKDTTMVKCTFYLLDIQSSIYIGLHETTRDRSFCIKYSTSSRGSPRSLVAFIVFDI